MTPFWTRLLGLTLITLILDGCGTSPPTHYHALSIATPAQVSGRARMLVEILPVAMPERLNREEMVLTGESGQLTVRDSDHWAAPLSDEIRHIIAEALWRHLWAADVYQAPVTPSADGLPQYRLALRIERFEAIPGRSAVVEGSWTARHLPQGQPITCLAGIAIPLSDRTPEAAASALSKATSQLARLIADSIAQMEQDGTRTCPSEGS